MVWMEIPKATPHRLPVDRSPAPLAPTQLSTIFLSHAFPRFTDSKARSLRGYP